MVPGGGLEPPRSCDLRILSPLRLPIPPSGLSLILVEPALRAQQQKRRARLAGTPLVSVRLRQCGFLYSISSSRRKYSAEQVSPPQIIDSLPRN